MSRAGKYAADFRRSLRLAAYLLLAIASASTGETPAIKSPLQRRLEALILPEVKFRNSDFIGALAYFQQKARQRQAAGRDGVLFNVDLPASFRPRYELTLDLTAVPFWEALHFLGEQAGVEFSTEGDVVAVRPLGFASAAQAGVHKEKPVPSAPAPAKGLTGPLGKPAEPASNGGSTYRSIGGVIQPEKSGTVPRRSLSGWSTDRDPANRVGVNCIRPDKCPASDCGCYLCCCHTAKEATRK
jgi:hypothetical protein